MVTLAPKVVIMKMGDFMRLKVNDLKELKNKIEEFDRIVVFRHEAPDYDAHGSQFGFSFWLKHNFPLKEILTLGDHNVKVGKNLYPDTDTISDEELQAKPFLAIVLDTAVASRISDKRYRYATYLVKIDHHPEVDAYGDLNIVTTKAAATCELIYKILTHPVFKGYSLEKEGAKFLYSGLVGDTGRFQNSSTTPYSLYVGSKLLAFDFNVQQDVYMALYGKSIRDFAIMKQVLNNYQISEKGVAYFHLDAKALEELGLDSDEAKIYLYLFSYCEEVKVWIAFSEDSRTNNWRASIRSRDIVINKVAAKYGGGGHKVAAGARPETYADTLRLVEDIGNLW